MRSILSGNLTVGTISIPVRFYGASQDAKVGFNQVHKEDKGRVRYLKVCSVCQKPLTEEDICSGYEVAGQMLTFTDEELKALKPTTNKSIQLVGFVDRNEIPDILLDKPYFVGTENPKKGGVAQPFQLLHQALVKSGKVGIVRWVSRSSESIGFLMPYGKGFLLKRLLYANEVRSVDEVEVLESAIPESLVEKGLKLVEKLTVKFDHDSFHESYSEGIRKVIEARAMGEEIPIEAIAPKTEASSLEAQLDALVS